MFAEERHADRVKRIKSKIKQEDEHKEFVFYLISLLEHKLYVDYSIHMQIFRYMVYIWERYERECEEKEPHCTGRKGFQYPPIIPIVYYEGKTNWTAYLEFKEKVVFGEQFEKYIPNFSYYLIPIHQYSNKMLMERGDEISIVMMLNRLQTEEDITELSKIPPEKFDAVLEDTPNYLLDIIAKVFRAFLLKMNMPEKETDELVGRVKVRHMGELFGNMDKMDIQAERRKTQEAKEIGIKELIISTHELGGTKDYVINKLRNLYDLQDAEIMELVKKYWNQ